MKERPKEISRLAAMLVAIALSFPLQVMIAYGYHPLEVGAMLAGLAPLNWLVILLSIVHAVLVYQASPYVILSTPVFLASVIWNNWLVAWAGLNYSAVAVFFATLGAIVSHLPLLKQEVRKVFLNPKLRWWRTPARTRAHIQALVRPVKGGELRTMTYDLSTGGAFISLEKANWSLDSVRMMKNLQVGTHCSVRLMINQLHVLQCGAEIVRHASSTGKYPGGFAVRFVSLDERQRKLLASCVSKSPAQASVA